MTFKQFIQALQNFGLTFTETPSYVILVCPQPGHPDDGKANNFRINKRTKQGSCNRCDTKVDSYQTFLDLVGRAQHDLPDHFAEIVKESQEKYDITAIHDHQPEKLLIDASQFKPMTSDELVDILGATIRKDDENKKIAFLVQLSAYTESSQLNLLFNAPSSTGKSYIPTEIARLFPDEDVMETGYCSPTAFFHDVGSYNKEKNEMTVDLSRKILIFLDQPHNLLLQHLRPILSHDKKIIKMKITDHVQKGGLRTKNVLIKGFPAVVFCTAGLKIDEQEATRFILLSPQTDVEKIRQAVLQKLKKEKDPDAYRRELESDPKRKLLKERILAIKQENIEDIKIGSPEKIEKIFFEKAIKLKPRHSRDIGKIISLIKAFALLNLWFRAREGSTIIANDDDINEAFRVWDAISESQELNLPPYIYAIYKEILIPLWRDDVENYACSEAQGKTTRDITRKHFEIYGRSLAEWLWQQMIGPMLEDAGLIYRERDDKDKRKWLYYPAMPLTTSDGKPTDPVQKEIWPSMDEPYPGKVDAVNNSESSPWADDEIHD